MRFTVRTVLKAIYALNVVHSDMGLADILKSQYIILLLRLVMYVNMSLLTEAILGLEDYYLSNYRAHCTGNV